LHWAVSVVVIGSIHGRVHIVDGVVLFHSWSFVHIVNTIGLVRVAWVAHIRLRLVPVGRCAHNMVSIVMINVNVTMLVPK
jgi:hypothetical protein